MGFISAFRLHLLISRLLLKTKADDVQFTSSTWMEVIATCCSHLLHLPSPPRTLGLLRAGGSRSTWFSIISVVRGRHPAHREPGWVRASLPWSLHHSQMHSTRPMSLTARQEGDPYPSRRCTKCSQCSSHAGKRHHIYIINLLYPAVFSLGSSQLPVKSAVGCALIPQSGVLCSVIQTIWLHWHCAAQKLFAETEKVRQMYRGLKTDV